MVFQLSTGSDLLAFRNSGASVPGVMQTWNATYERIGWTQQTVVHIGLVVACLLVFAVYGVHSLRTWRRWHEGRPARVCALFVALANVTFMVWLGASIRTLGETTPLPPAQAALLGLGVAAAAVSALLPAFTVLAWRERWWTRRGRVSYTLLAACAVVFAAWLDYWKLLGFQY
jgi:hypothetical protein